MTKGWIDAHCHLSDARIFSTSSQLVEQAQEKNVFQLVLAGVEPEEWARQKLLQIKYPESFILNFGIHPWTVEKYSESEIDSAMNVLRAELPFAHGLGETGLDYGKKRDPASFEKQRLSFRKQIRLAIEFSKPLVLHVVQAHEDAIKILKEEKAHQVSMMVHSYSGNSTQLGPYLDLGAMISFSGTIVAQDGYEKVKKALKHTPLDRILFETDSPDQSWQKEVANVPANVVQVYEAAAGLLEVPLEPLREKVADNLGKIYYSRP